MIELKQHQKDGMKKALNVKNSLICMKVGEGKTFTALFTLRKLIKDKKIDKGIIFCTKTSAVPFISDLEKVANISIKVIEKEDAFFEALRGKDKIILVKHSMIAKLGNNMFNIEAIADYAETHNLMAIIDEAHELQNPTGVEHRAWDNLRPYIARTMLLTATPYSSELVQLYGLVALIYPKLWKSRTAFNSLYVDETIIRDRRGRVLKKEVERYKNLTHLREVLEPFTFFWYPPVKLNFFNHTTRLKDYTEYDEICQGIVTEWEERNKHA